jgi:Mrp family chromosome partitioning ATPase
MNQPSIISASEAAGNGTVSTPIKRGWRMRNVAPPLQPHYRSLLANLRQPLEGHDGLPQVIGVAGTHRREGTSTIALNLATCAARSLDQSVLLVDAHLDHPSLTTLLRSTGPGLGDYLRGEVELPDCLHQSAYDPFTLLPAGKVTAAGAWDPRSVAALMESLRNEFALVIVDFPPITDWKKSQMLAQRTDGILFVVAAEQTSSGSARRALDRLERCQVPVLGAVLNGSRFSGV